MSITKHITTASLIIAIFLPSHVFAESTFKLGADQMEKNGYKGVQITGFKIAKKKYIFPAAAMRKILKNETIRSLYMPLIGQNVYFSTSDTGVDALNTGYGKIYSYDIKKKKINEVYRRDYAKPEDASVIRVVGSGDNGSVIFYNAGVDNSPTFCYTPFGEETFYAFDPSSKKVEAQPYVLPKSFVSSKVEESNKCMQAY